MSHRQGMERLIHGSDPFLQAASPPYNIFPHQLKPSAFPTRVHSASLHLFAQGHGGCQSGCLSSARRWAKPVCRNWRDKASKHKSHTSFSSSGKDGLFETAPSQALWFGFIWTILHWNSCSIPGIICIKENLKICEILILQVHYFPLRNKHLGKIPKKIWTIHL